MKKLVTDEKGNTLVEMVMVMFLVILFSMTMYVLISAGSNTQKKILSHKDSQVEARIASSFINVRIRQNDESNKIKIRRNINDGKNGVVIEKRSEDTSYDTWIFFYDGKLLEVIVAEGEYPKAENGSKIAEIQDFEINFDSKKNLINSKIFYKYDKGENGISFLESIINLRAESDNYNISNLKE